jgi:CRISPR/Cas system-associated protein Csx1
MTEGIKKTSKEWYEELYPNREVIIMDPDGWDRSNWEFSWGEELIDKNEFAIRVMSSTCMYHIENSK